MKNLDLKYYRQFNTDLAHFSDVELKNHYNTFGKNEGRITAFFKKNVHFFEKLIKIIKFKIFFIL